MTSPNSFKRSKSLVKRTRSFFGVESDYSVNEIDAWNQRRLKFCVNKFGNLNQEKLKLNDLSQSINIRDDDSLLANVDCLDGSYQMSCISQYPFNLNTTIASQRSKGCLNSSIMSPQTSIQTFREPIKKRNAFRAIAEVLSESISKPKNDQSEDNPSTFINQNLLEIEEPMEMKFVSLKTESAPKRLRGEGLPRKCSMKKNRSINKRISFKWSESMVKRFSFRRKFTDSLMGRIICCLPNYSDETKQLSKQIDGNPQYRPYFTYWVSLVQIIVFISSLSVYGLAPIRMDFIHQEIGEVLVANAAIEQVCRVEYVNLFVGLRQADLIRLGARYSPCMRKDKNLHTTIIKEQRDRDRRSGCCIRNDGGGCYQTTEKLCSYTLATWINRKSNNENASLNSVVCGLDPEFCEEKKSIAPFQWSEDIIEWPTCPSKVLTSSNNTSMKDKHMKCEVTGRPCCIGSKAECIVTTRQHCTFLRGYYHPEAAFCSQVNCLNEICGMLSFYDQSRPDQFYRFLIAIFVNSSLGSLVVTLCIQLSVVRDLEKMSGWHRISIIYILSGIMGNMCSGIFLPYQVQTGASGSIFAMLAMTFAEFLQSWKIVERPWPVFFKFLGLGIFLFLLGFLPFFDNYAHMSGLISGIILSLIFLPFLGMPNKAALEKLIASSVNPKEAWEKFQIKTKRRRMAIIIGCAGLWLLLMAICIVLFYWLPVTKCSFCKYLNCIPITPYFCDNMDVNVTSKTACILKD